MSRESLLEERMDAQREERVFAPVPEPSDDYPEPEPPITIGVGKIQMRIEDANSVYASRGMVSVSIDSDYTARISRPFFTVEVKGTEVKIIANSEELEKVKVVKEVESESLDIDDIEF